MRPVTWPSDEATRQFLAPYVCLLQSDPSEVPVPRDWTPDWRWRMQLCRQYDLSISASRLCAAAAACLGLVEGRRRPAADGGVPCVMIRAARKQ